MVVRAGVPLQGPQALGGTGGVQRLQISGHRFQSRERLASVASILHTLAGVRLGVGFEVQVRPMRGRDPYNIESHTKSGRLVRQ